VNLGTSKHEPIEHITKTKEGIRSDYGVYSVFQEAYYIAFTEIRYCLHSS
jgi:hypothetical protein